MNPELLYQISLTLIPNIGTVQAKILLQHFTARDIFKTPVSILEKVEGIGSVRAQSIKKFSGFHLAEKEIAFIEKYKIRTLFLKDKDYPQRLLNCYDPPTLLYYRGEADLNASRIVAIIGTRNHTEYGKQFTEKLIKELSPYHIFIISGLAYGIDGIAHKAALKNHLKTTGVLAHGLDKIYPHEHLELAKEMVKQGGGLLTEFRHDEMPDKHNFPIRNRIVAGISDAVIVIETGIKGGSMITAELANSYNRDVFALPGKITDAKSAGCNSLIRNNKAILLTDAREIVELLNWDEKTKAPIRQRQLFPDLSPDEKKLVDILIEKESAHIDQIYLQSGLSNSTVAAAMLSLELQNVVLSLPGKLYRLA